MEFIDFNDTTIPIGKRKVAYVKWAMHKGTPEKTARMLANKKFGWEKNLKLCLFATNSRAFSTMCAYEHYSEYQLLQDNFGSDVNRAKDIKIIWDSYPSAEIIKEWESKGYKVKVDWCTL